MKSTCGGRTAGSDINGGPVMGLIELKAWFEIAGRFIGVFWIKVIAIFSALAPTSPVVTAIAIPKHGLGDGCE